MKERETSKQYNSIPNIKDKSTGETQTVKEKRKSHSWAKWGTIAVCLCLVAAILLWPKESQIEEKDIGSMGEYNGRDFTLDRDFDSEMDKKDSIEAYDMIQYGDVEVVIYREEDIGWGDPYLYQAEFILDDVTYGLSLHSDSSDDIYAYLDMVLDEPKGGEAPSGAVLTSVLGFDVCRIEMEEVSSYQYMWHYYVEVDGEDVCGRAVRL